MAAILNFSTLKVTNVEILTQPYYLELIDEFFPQKVLRW